MQHWFKEQAREQNAQAGKLMVERELTRMALNGTDYAQLIDRLGLKSQEDLFVAVGSGDLRLAHVVNVAQQLIEPDRHSEQLELIPKKPSRNVGRRGDVYIQGVGNLMTQLAGCCQPVPGDPIIGYITLGRGVTVHRADCANAMQLQDRDSERLIEVSWGGAPVQTYRWRSTSRPMTAPVCCAMSRNCWPMRRSTYWRSVRGPTRMTITRPCC
ncbi:RelA/SpoT AH/RIS domain-containing protein [Halopseudomonas pachastrellae]|nr:RelA/SpoT AH/RIS domain-containing protein [Halopseudomonas pachastrellae]